MIRRSPIPPALLAITLAGAMSYAASGAPRNASEAVGRTLDAFHDAASRADEEAYFSLFAPEGVFLGTAAEERWTVEQFRAFVHPYFSRDVGWTYTPRKGARNIVPGPKGRVASFDEVLDNDKYGECRGTGSLRRIAGEWKIVQYNLMIPIPNEIAAEVVDRIRGATKPPEGD